MYHRKGPQSLNSNIWNFRVIYALIISMVTYPLTEIWSMVSISTMSAYSSEVYQPLVFVHHVEQQSTTPNSHLSFHLQVTGS